MTIKAEKIDVGKEVKHHLEKMIELLNAQSTKNVKEVQRLVSILQAVLSIASHKDTWPTWKKSDTTDVYREIGMQPKPEVMNAGYRKRLFQTNQHLCRILKFLKSRAGMKVSSMPELNLYPRSNQAVSQDEKAFELLNDYHDILRYYQSHRPNIGVKNYPLQPDIMLVLMAFDGVLRKDADLRLAYLQKKHVCLDHEARILIPLGKRDGYKHLTKTYPIGDMTQLYLKIMLPRVKHVQGKDYLFPREWRPRNKAKVSRRIDLNRRLKEIWRIVHPDKPVPNNWNVDLWIRLGRLSLELMGTPYMLIASLTGKLRTAQLKRGDESEPEHLPDAGEQNRDEMPSERVYDIEHDMMSEMLFLAVRNILLRYGYKEKHMGPKRKAASEIRILIEDYIKFLESTPNVKLLLEWVVWLLQSQQYRKTAISTFLTYISVLPCRLLPLLGGESLGHLTSEEWTDLASYLASDMEYASSSRRQTMTHLKSLYEFMFQIGIGVPAMDWNNYAFRVSKGIPEAHVVGPSEIDAILSSLRPDDAVWIAIVLAFYGGLRCEEICGLKPSDLLDGYKLQIAWSKRHTSRRSLPIGWLVPEEYWDQLLDVIKRKQESGASRIVTEINGKAIKPNTLGKRVSRVLINNNVSVRGIHALRHGFASWALIRYFMLIDPDFRLSAMAGNVCDKINPSQPIFSDISLKRLARVFGGAVWEDAWSNTRICPGIPTDIAIIAMLLGHTNRFTPIENYFNSIEWLVRYYMGERWNRIASRTENGSMGIVPVKEGSAVS